MKKSRSKAPFKAALFLTPVFAAFLLVLLWTQGLIFLAGPVPELTAPKGNVARYLIQAPWRDGRKLAEEISPSPDGAAFYSEFQNKVDSMDPARVPLTGGFDKGNPTRAKVFLVGVDGADWSLLTPLVEQGIMPNLARLLSRSSYGWLATDEANSPVSWTSIATGKCRAKTLTIGDVENPWEYDYQVVKVRRLWDILAPARGRGLALINYYFMPPADLYPEGILIDHDRFEDKESAKTALRIIKRKNSDYLFFIEKQTDELQHGAMFSALITYLDAFSQWHPAKTWPAGQYGKKVRELIARYRKIDRLIGHLLEHHQEDFIVVVSDHGFFAREPRIRIDPAALVASDRPEFATLSQAKDGEKTTPWVFEQTPFEISRRTEGWSFDLYQSAQIDNPLALTLLFEQYTFCAIGAEGKQAPARLGELLQDFSREEGWPFRIVQEESCVTIEASRGLLDYAIGNHSYQFNSHREQDAGVVVLSGPGIAQGLVLKDAHLFDITPTLLYLLGYPVAADMDGKILTGAINPEVLKARLPRQIPTYETLSKGISENPQKINLTDEARRRLRSLGYL